MVKRRKTRKVYHQVGKTNIYIDRRILAKIPGKRIVRHGKKKPTVYYEYRRNRSDVNKRTRL